jgi:hypothetical protein
MMVNNNTSTEINGVKLSFNESSGKIEGLSQASLSSSDIEEIEILTNSKLMRVYPFESAGGMCVVFMDFLPVSEFKVTDIFPENIEGVKSVSYKPVSIEHGCNVADGYEDSADAWSVDVKNKKGVFSIALLPEKRLAVKMCYIIQKLIDDGKAKESE